MTVIFVTGNQQSHFFVFDKTRRLSGLWKPPDRAAPRQWTGEDDRTASRHKRPVVHALIRSEKSWRGSVGCLCLRKPRLRGAMITSIRATRQCNFSMQRHISATNGTLLTVTTCGVLDEREFNAGSSREFLHPDNMVCIQPELWLRFRPDL